MLVLIVGITGSLGQRFADAAKSRGLSIRGLGRMPDKLPPELSRHLESFVKSESYYDVSALEKAVGGVDAVICSYSPDPVLDLETHFLLLQAAERAQGKIFIASFWKNDWTKLKLGEFRLYDNHVAFEQQVIMTSSCRPVYIFTGLFADLLFTPMESDGLDTSNGTSRMRYSGNGNLLKWLWTTRDDAAAWIINLLCHDKGVRAGKSGYLQLRSGQNTIEELSVAYERDVWKRGGDNQERHPRRPQK